MEFIVKCSSRWENGHYYRQMSFNDILKTFFTNDDDSDIDEMIDGVANMNVNTIYSFDFFMDNTYTFRRIK